jgi:acetyl-CoA carboxylase biotin carboxyl carrier protein
MLLTLINYQSLMIQGGNKMTEITSPMAGRIAEINMEVGQTITEDDELFVIEAMKMENVVYGDPGVVNKVLVKVGDEVEEDQVLAIVE